MQSLNHDQLLDLLRVAQEHSKRDHLMILVAYSHGLRSSEIVNLTTRSIRDAYITVQRLKGSRKTVQPLVFSSNPLLDEKGAMTAYLASVPANGRLFPISRIQFWRLVQKYAALAGIANHLAHPHTLKHTCGKLALKAGMEIDELRQYLGHESLSSTGHYVESDDQTASTAFAAAMGYVL